VSSAVGAEAVKVASFTLASPAVRSVVQIRPPPTTTCSSPDWNPPMVDVARVAASIRVIVLDPRLATHAAVSSSAIEAGARPTAVDQLSLPLPGARTATLFNGTRAGGSLPPSVTSNATAAAAARLANPPATTNSRRRFPARALGRRPTSGRSGAVTR